MRNWVKRLKGAIGLAAILSGNLDWAWTQETCHFKDTLQLNVTPVIGKRVFVSNNPSECDDDPSCDFVFSDDKGAYEEPPAEDGISDVELPPEPPPLDNEAHTPAWRAGNIVASFQAPAGSEWRVRASESMRVNFECESNSDVEVIRDASTGHSGEAFGRVIACGEHTVTCRNYTDLVESGTSYYEIIFDFHSPPFALCCDKRPSVAIAAQAARPQVAEELPTRRPYSDLFLPGEYTHTATSVTLPQNGFQTPAQAFLGAKTGGECPEGIGGSRVLGCVRALFIESRWGFQEWVWAQDYRVGGPITCRPTGANVIFETGDQRETRLVKSADIKGRPIIRARNTIKWVTFRNSDGPFYGQWPKQQAGLDAFSTDVESHEWGHVEHGKAFIEGNRPGPGGIKLAFEKWVPDRIVKTLRRDYRFDGSNFIIPANQAAGVTSVEQADDKCRVVITSVTWQAYLWAMGRDSDAFNPDRTLKREAPQFKDSPWGYWHWWSVYWDFRQKGNVCFWPMESPNPSGPPYTGTCAPDTLGSYVGGFGYWGIWDSYWPYWGGGSTLEPNAYTREANGWLIYRRTR